MPPSPRSPAARTASPGSPATTVVFLCLASATWSCPRLAGLASGWFWRGVGSPGLWLADASALPGLFVYSRALRHRVVPRSACFPSSRSNRDSTVGQKSRSRVRLCSCLFVALPLCCCCPCAAVRFAPFARFGPCRTPSKTARRRLRGDSSPSRHS